MSENQTTPWYLSVGIAASMIAFGGLFFDMFTLPKRAVTPSAAVSAQIQPAPAPAPMTDEQKAERSAQKAKEDEENRKFARDVAVVRQLRSSMKNPASFDLETANRVDDGTLCVSYRATNSFNAIIPGEAVITKDKIYTSDNRERFVAEWNKRCANKSGKNLRHIRMML